MRCEMAERDCVLKVGFEGGFHSILRIRAPDGAWRFVALTDETTLADLLDKDDREGLSFSGGES